MFFFEFYVYIYVRVCVFICRYSFWYIFMLYLVFEVGEIRFGFIVVYDISVFVIVREYCLEVYSIYFVRFSLFLGFDFFF